MSGGPPPAQGPDVTDGEPPQLSAKLRAKLPEGTTAWAVLQPNASGAGEWRSRRGFQQRQLLKSQGLCPAERMFVAVGADEVAMYHAIPGRIIGGCIGRWRRDALVVELVEAVGVQDPWWPAVRLSVRRHGPAGTRRLAPIAEMRAVRDEPRARAVVELLLAVA